MNCCTPKGYRSIFGAKTVERDERRYRRKGLTGSARWILDALLGDGVHERSVVEIGGGIGALQIELLAAGATRTANVEIIDSYEPVARSLIAEHNLAGRVDRHIADFAQRPHEAPAADIVIMHRVICCYPNADALMAAACDQSRDRIAITVPRNAWWVNLGFSTMNAWFRLRRIDFHAYVHPSDRMLEVAGARDFHPSRHQRARFWESFILERRSSAQPSNAAQAV